MNERMRELAEQAGFSFKYKTVPDELNPGNKLQDLEKFAELIIKECVGRIKLQHQMDEVTDDWVYNTIQTDLKEHFGVKE